MQGRILTYDSARNIGIISGKDGKRYKFSQRAFNGEGNLLVQGTTVDFDLDETGEIALDIYVLEKPKSNSDVSNKKIVAALLAFFLGGLGVHKFYLGKNTAGVIMLICGTIGLLLIIPALVIYTIAFIEFIIYLIKSDEDFQADYVDGNKAWF